MNQPIKLLGSLLVAISLILGATAAATAYLAPVDSIDPTAEPVTLHAPAGRDDSLPPQPVLRPGPRDAPLTLTAEHLTLLHNAGVTRVHVKEFSFGCSSPPDLDLWCLIDLGFVKFADQGRQDMGAC